MLGLSDLKATFSMTEVKIECPVSGCDTVVPRRKKGDKRPNSTFLCKNCKIFVYPSTFKYENDIANLLWTDKADVALLDEIKQSKAETHRIGHDNSEDAVTWNVFWYFDRSDQIPHLLSHLTQKEDNRQCEAVYWSYFKSAQKPWNPLIVARVEFGEASNADIATMGKRVSEPDIIFLTNDSLIFVEAKVGSSNRTSGDQKAIRRILKNPKKYQTGGDGWYQKVFKTEFAEIVEDQKYELLRFWLLGSWIARNLGKKFILVNLVRSTEEKNIESDFGKHIKQTENQAFVRWTWEGVGSLLNDLGDCESNRLLEYLKNKVLGFEYDVRSQLARPRKAFQIE